MKSKRERALISFILTAALIITCSGRQVFVSCATADQPATEAGSEEAATTEAAATEAQTTEAKSTEAAGDTSSDDVQGTATDNGTADASVEKAREDAKEADKKLKSAQEILKNLKDIKNNIEKYVIELDKSINELQIEITHLEQNQKELEETIEDTRRRLAEAQAAQENQYEQMKKRIQMVYESGNKHYLDVLLTATSMTDMLNKTEYVTYVSMYDYNILKELKKAREQVANIKMKLDKDLESNKKLQEEVNAQKDNMKTLVDEKKVQISEFNSSIANQEQEVQKYMNAKAEAESIIAQAEAAASSGDGSQYTGGTFTWPAPGNYTITSYFGGRTSPVAGASSNHMGIDIACSTGDPIVAAASGTVIVAAYNYAEGNYVCIDHGGVVTLYMHNSSLAVSVGEQVTAGQTIAYAGSTGISTGPHCHFGVRVNGSYVDPLTYLQ